MDEPRRRAPQGRLATLTPGQRQLLWEKLGAAAGGGDAAAQAVRAADVGELPASAAQERLWLAHQLDPGGRAHSLALALRLRGGLDADALGRALAEIVRRHEALRTTFTGGGGRPVQVIHPVPDPPARLPVVALTAAPTGLARRLSEEAGRPFDLYRGPVLRAALFAAAAHEHVLLAGVHHIAFDAWSQAVFLGELAALYGAFATGRPSPLPDLPLQYADFALWQRGRLAGPLAQQQLAYWRGRLEGTPQQLDLPFDRPRPAALTGPATSEGLTLPAGIASRLVEVGRRQGATLFVTLLAAWMTLLHRITGQHDIVVGVPAAGRPRREFEGLIGCFLNTLALRADLSGNPRFVDLLAQVQRAALDAFEHGEVPFERVVEALGPERAPGRHPLFQVMFVMRDAPVAPAFPGLAAEVLAVAPAEAEFDLTLDVTAGAGGGLAAALVCRADRFEPAAIRRIAGYFRTMLAAIAADPGRRIGSLPLLDEAGRGRLQASCRPSHGDRRGPLPCVHRMFEKQAADRPDGIAVVAGEDVASYAGLDREADRLAERLRGMGVGPGAIVGLCSGRSIAAVAGLLGILKAGAAYLPLDPSYPPGRLAFMLQEAGARVVLAARQPAEGLGGYCGPIAWLDDAPAADPGGARACPANPCTPGDLAYVIYTSGSTGRPKGVMVEHGSLSRLVHHARSAYGLGPGDRVLQFHSLGFDASVGDIFPCLASGATLVLRSEAMTASAAGFWDELRARGVTVASLPASFWHRLAEEMRLLPPAEPPPGLRLVIFGGEPARTGALGPWRGRLGPDARLVNQYGPTEATVVATACEITRASPDGGTAEIPIGRPLPYVRACVLDEYLNPCPAGVPGELYLGGDGLARGYVGRPDLTAERFIPDPFAREPGPRLYRTGDRVRCLPDGNLAFLGRLDRQIKLNGYRIEPGEIEAALMQHPDVREAHVTAAAAAAGGQRLVAYVAPRIDGLAGWLAGRLPAYMLPAAFVLLDALPRRASGKIDPAGLPAAGAEPPAARAPLTVTEELVSNVMASVLGLAAPGRDDSFFALGGHSLLAAQVMARLGQASGLNLPLSALFEHPTVAGLASYVERARRTPALESTPVSPDPPAAGTPLSPAQAPFWRAARALPGVPLFAMPVLLRLDGPLDPDALARSLAELTRRHHILRSVVAERQGQAVMVAGPPAPFPLALADLGNLPGDEDEALVQRLAAGEFARPFDLRSEPPLRGALARLGPDRHALCLTAHHIAADGGSVAVLVEELAAAYAAFAVGLPEPLPEPPLQYAGWVRWQQAWLRGGEAAGQLAYWSKRLAGEVAPLDLPTSRPRSTPRTYRYARERHSIPPALFAGLRRLSREQDVTLFMAFLAGLNALLRRYSGQDDVRVATVSANRTRPETERLIGLLANTLILRTQVPRDLAGRELLQRTRHATLEAYVNQELPFEVLLEALRRRQDAPLEGPRVLLVYQSHAVQPVHAAGLQFRPAAAACDSAGEYEFTPSTFDWIIEADPRPDGLDICLRYNADLFERDLVRRALGDLEACLARLAAHPGQPVA